MFKNKHIILSLQNTGFYSQNQINRKVKLFHCFVLFIIINIIIIQVTGEGSNRQREKIQRQRDPAPLTEVGTNCKLTFKMPGNYKFLYISNALSLHFL